MSRARNARKKARRQQARAVSQAQHRGWTSLGRRVPIIPILAIAGVLTATAVIGFGLSGGAGEAQANREVRALLAGVPQRGNTLGSPKAPITLKIFADLQCPTVRLYVENFLPVLVNTWVRTGRLKLTYHSLQTDTGNERMFFGQETAALAAGRQDEMWTFVLTFLHEQEQLESVQTEPEIEALLVRTADQVPGLDRRSWRQDWTDQQLIEKVSRGVRFAHAHNFDSTPSFLIRYTGGKAGKVELDDLGPLDKQFLAFFRREFNNFTAEVSDRYAELANSTSPSPAFNDTPRFGGIVP
jgi:protein-disulfide isomerase